MLINEYRESLFNNWKISDSGDVCKAFQLNYARKRKKYLDYASCEKVHEMAITKVNKYGVLNMPRANIIMNYNL